MQIEFYSYIERELSKKKEKNLYRKFTLPNGIDFSSNDYLGLSKDIRIIDFLIEGLKKYGAGSTASRLIRGHRDVFEELERTFSELVGGGAGLFVANGYTANLGLLDSIADIQTVVFTDRLNHASILDGIRLSGAKKIYYSHLDMLDLGKKLEKHSSSPKKIIVSETVFSMDGDVLPIDEFLKLAEEFDAITVLDETHAVGVFGKYGGGLSCDENLLTYESRSKIDFRIYTLGKALGLEGGMIICNNPISIDYLVNSMRNFIFSTAPLPAIAFAGIRSCEILKTEKIRVENVLNNSNYFRELIQELPIPKVRSSSQIIPILLDSEDIALTIARKLQDSGLDVRAIRPPTVPSSRLRISIHSDHTKEELDSLAHALEKVMMEVVG